MAFTVPEVPLDDTTTIASMRVIDVRMHERGDGFAWVELGTEDVCEGRS